MICASENETFSKDNTMAVLDYTRPAATGLSVGGRVIATMNKAVADFAGWRAATATKRQLSRLSDHELEDIGLCRGDIDQL